jgi:hypothetical protein
LASAVWNNLIPTDTTFRHGIIFIDEAAHQRQLALILFEVYTSNGTVFSIVATFWESSIRHIFGQTIHVEFFSRDKRLINLLMCVRTLLVSDNHR